MPMYLSRLFRKYLLKKVFSEFHFFHYFHQSIKDNGNQSKIKTEENK